MTRTVLILGASGRFGRHAAEAFWNAGWAVRTFDRQRDDLMQAARGAQVIVNGWNPAYPDWQAQLPQQAAQLIPAVRASGARLIQAANLYVYGAGAPPCLSADTPHAATNPLGRARIAFETQLRAADIPVIFLRAGDFLDTEASGNWFDRVMAKPLPRGRLSYPGDPDVPHAWAFLPDLGHLTQTLAAREADLPRVLDLPYPGLTLTGHTLAALCADALGREVTLRRMPWAPLRLVAPLWPLARHLVEMRYLWQMPHHVDPAPLKALCPEAPQTPAAEAVARAVAAAMARPDRPRPDDAAPRPRLTA